MTDRTVPTEEMIVAGLEHYAEGGCMGLTEDERREAVCAILAAALAASPAAPGAEEEPAAILSTWDNGQYRRVDLTPQFEAWLRDKDSQKYPLYRSPPTTDAIRAQARREAAKAAASRLRLVADSMEERCTGFYPDDLREIASALIVDMAEPFADKPGEAEGWRPIATAPKDGTRILAVENFKREGDDGRLYPEDAAVVRWATPRHDDHGGWSGYGLFLESFEPTHWRPLPTPPSAQGGGDGE
ncbi:hypothetical protein [Ancylobacter sp.]|uniref:hypothetical protein n=1 Tax=Ancylobacter sp. TaxID=1872567 RepID=UPI003D0D81C7